MHIATSLNGGAGIAARRIAQAQVDSAMDVSLIAGNGDSTHLKSHENLFNSNRIKKFQSKSVTMLQSKLIQKSDLLETPIGISSDVLNVSEIASADIIHFHAFYNFVRIREIFELSWTKKIVVTIHDERLFTGGCHYSFDCEGFMKDCSKCPQVNHLFSKLPQKELAKNMASNPNESNVRIISPSIWLGEFARKSALLKRFEISVVENPVDPIFAANSVVKKFNSGKKIQLGFVSENLDNPYKGLNLLLKAFSNSELRSKYELLLFGNGSDLNIPAGLDVKQTSYRDSASAANAMRACDVIIVPSLQDNFPSVVIEALMSGTPVIGSRTGGIPEVLNSYDLPVFEAGNLLSLQKVLLNFQKIEFTEEQLVEIHERFSFAASSAAHARIYKKLIN